MVSINPCLRLRAGVVLVLLILTGTACTEESPPGVADSADPGIGHVHGLGVDPADGTVYVAGHYGLFQIRSTDTARRVADRIQDHMGFTVVGPKTFLASGHPGEADASSGASPHLGLIRTTDAGATWTSVSEAGTADFHAIQSAGSNIYAFDSQTGQVRRSGDEGRTWKLGAREEVIDLAGNAEEPDRVYATTPRGVQVSDDGGMAFTTLSAAPLLSHVDSPAKGELVGVGGDGRIHASDDGGKTWQALGKVPGQATAFTAVDGTRLLAAMEDGTVLQSTDGGRGFTVIFRPAATG
ncbi:F510_1955 family glycosylhydrolase [Streptosporangium sp. NPDC002544]|uniref:F510_1955 family glycosylhydrolase n=1 Tax=Streptosporangium sp. NPDC002544 TaxID=3154538 RepID=UPI00332DB7EF